LAYDFVTIQPREMMGRQSQESWCNTIFVQLTIPSPASTVVNAFINESQKIKSFEDIDHGIIIVLEAKIKVIEGVDLYDLVQAIEMFLVPIVVVPKFCVLKLNVLSLTSSLIATK
jgi:hypothetical protein